MPRGALTEYLDVAQVVLYGFWVFFAGLIWYIRQEDRREGYPLENAKTGEVGSMKWPFLPDPKTFLLHDGRTVSVPNSQRDTRPIAARPIAPFPGAPIEPTGNPMRDGVGPASYAERMDEPDMTHHGEVKIVPLRAAHGYSVCAEDPDPRGMPVVACDGKEAGKIVDIWVDQSEHVVRYLEVAAGMRNVLLPITFAIVKSEPRFVYVNAITSEQFADVPGTKSPNQITFLEEDRICGYFGGGTLYATPGRSEPIL